MIALLNEAASEDLLDFLGNLCKGIGSGYDYSNCYFWDELDDYERSQMQKFDGIYAETEDGESVQLRFIDVYKYMELLLERYCLEHPEEEKMLKHMLNEYSKKYCK